MASPQIGQLELTILLSVARLGDDAYGLAVRRDLAERTGREHSVGAIYTTLDRLQTKGLLSAQAGHSTPEREGRSRRLFRVTTAGRSAIRDAERLARSMWLGIANPLNPKGA